jgi:hypothetical protein
VITATIGGHASQPGVYNLEDETGMINVICSAGVWNRYRRIARESSTCSESSAIPDGQSAFRHSELAGSVVVERSDETSQHGCVTIRGRVLGSDEFVEVLSVEHEALDRAQQQSERDDHAARDLSGWHDDRIRPPE